MSLNEGLTVWTQLACYFAWQEGLEENFDDRVGFRTERNEIGYALV